ncbi:collagenase 3-like [Diadema setosum]|uniref:collagenase 3-like n=1 Tax=Diadema setosum TaxID=31175 RepID=UPI003B3B714E
MAGNRSSAVPLIFSLLLIFFVTADVSGAPVPETEEAKLAASLKFFTGYGYLGQDDIEPGKTAGETFESDKFVRAVQKLQVYANIEPTGELDEETVQIMGQRRCGMPDPDLQEQVDTSETTGAAARKRRYSVAGGNYRWNKNTLTYRIINYPGPKSNISQAQVRYDLREAFTLWSDVTPLVFVEIFEGRADIELLFGSRRHTEVYGDPAFDGEGGTLAHAFTPNSGWGLTNGDVHFDDDENYTHKMRAGVNFFYTAAHEIGHALGLDHSKDRSSLMWPWDKGYIPNFKLPLDDRLGIQVIYGKHPFADLETTTVAPTTTPTIPPVIVPPYCNTTIDAVADIRGTVMVFKNERLWRFRPRYNSNGSPDGTLPLVPVDIDNGISVLYFFQGLKRGIKTVYERQDGRIVFIKARKKWVYDGTTLIEGPVRTGDANTNFPSRVNAALYDRASGKTYLFKGSKVWLYDELSGQADRLSTQKVFRGLHPSANIEAAFSFYGRKFLIDGPDYFEANERNYVPYVGKRNFGIDILGCPPNQQPQIH